MVSVVEMCVLAGAHRVLALGGGGGGGGRMLEGIPEPQCLWAMVQSLPLVHLPRLK